MMNKRGMKMKGAWVGQEQDPRELPPQISAEVMRVDENTNQLVVKTLEEGLIGAWAPEVVFATAAAHDWWGSYKVLDGKPEDSEDGSSVITLKAVEEPALQRLNSLKEGDVLRLWSLFDEKKPVLAGLRLIVAPRYAIAADDVTVDAVAGADLAGAAAGEIDNLKKKGEQVDWGAQLALDGEELALAALADLLKGKIESSDTGLGVEKLAQALHGFQVMDAAFIPAVAGYSTRTMACTLPEALLRQLDGKTPVERKLYLNIDGEVLHGGTGLIHDNSKKETVERFDTFDIEATLFEMRGDLRMRAKESKRTQLEEHNEAANHIDPEYPQYLISVFDNEGNVLLKRCNVEKVLKIRTGSAESYRLVISDKDQDFLWGAVHVNEPRGLKLQNVKIVMEVVLCCLECC
jgi:hypothetical protein